MKVVFRNPVPAIKADLKYYTCINCKVEFRWSEGCMSRIIPEGKYHDKVECLCEKCSESYLTNQLKLEL
ncbi:hypothetical protein JOD96_001190 [Flavobacterium sp. 1355]|nr:hypothetical protein [Flavobacterium sp. 1355]